jgi:hypothetical protein
MVGRDSSVKAAFPATRVGGILPPLSRQSWIATVRPLVICYVVYQIAAALRVSWTQHAIDYETLIASSRVWLAGADAYVGVLPDGRGVNLNPPFVVAALVPLTWLQPSAAFWLWMGLNLAGLLLGLWLLSRRVPWEWAALGIMAPLAGGLSLELGQPTLLLLPLAVAAWRSPVALGVLMALKPFLGLFLVDAAWRRDWRRLLTIGGTVAALWAAQALLMPSEMIGWIGALRSVSWLDNPLNGSFFGMFNERIAGLLMAGYLVVFTLVRSPRLSEDQRWAALFLAGLLTAPLGWPYYLPWVVGPVLASAFSVWLLLPWAVLHLPQIVLLAVGGWPISLAFLWLWLSALPVMLGCRHEGTPHV